MQQEKTHIFLTNIPNLFPTLNYLIRVLYFSALEFSFDSFLIVSIFLFELFSFKSLNIFIIAILKYTKSLNNIVLLNTLSLMLMRQKIDFGLRPLSVWSLHVLPALALVQVLCPHT